MIDSKKITGSCTCGAVRYEALGKPIDVAYCHCSDCRGISGAPVVTWVAFETKYVNFTTGKRKTFESSPGISWGFCEHCGTSLTWEGNSFRYGFHITEFLIGTIDKPEAFIPDRHWFDGERLSWFDVADSLPRYTKMDYQAEPTHHGPKNVE